MSPSCVNMLPQKLKKGKKSEIIPDKSNINKDWTKLLSYLYRLH